jgi:ribosomal-protein-alanine acetyltransferase
VLRRAVQADGGAIAELESLALEDPWTSAMVLAALAEPTSRAWLAEHEDGAVGFALFRRISDELELLRLGVDPAWRRAGIGSELVARGLAEGLDSGASACHLEVRAANGPARRLYARLGFTEAGIRRSYYSDGSDACLYRRALEAKSG